MKHVAGILALLAVNSFAVAADAPAPILDKVQFQLSAKQWVTTQSALLGVNVNVTLSKADLVRARADIMNSLNKIAKADWHLLAFDRSQDSSGLEKLYVQAQARVDQAALTDIYQNAKSASMPGAQYDIGAVEFKPSLEESQAVRAKVRDTLYQQVNDEIARMNKAYPSQNYSVSNLVFVEGESVPQPRSYQAKTINTMSMAAAAAPALTVSNELVLTALVEVASTRK